MSTITLSNGKTINLYKPVKDKPNLPGMIHSPVLQDIDLNTGMTLSADKLTLYATTDSTGMSGVRSDANTQTSGKYYFEWTLNTIPIEGQEGNMQVGIVDDTPNFDNTVALGTTSDRTTASIGVNLDVNNLDELTFTIKDTGNNYVVYNKTLEQLSFRSEANGKVLGIMVDLDNKQLQIIYNNIVLSDIVTIPAGEFKPAITIPGGDDYSASVNFGESPYTYDVPVDYGNWYS